MEILETLPWVFCFPKSCFNENGGKCGEVYVLSWKRKGGVQREVSAFTHAANAFPIIKVKAKYSTT